MKHFFRIFLSGLAISLLAVGCSKETETLETASLADYWPMVPGKYIIYQLDSTITQNFGTAFKTVSYQARDLVDAEITDGMNRPSYRVVRSIRNLDGTGTWNPIATYSITHNGKTGESNEDNLRFMKLQLPIRENFSWKGNSYIDTYSPSSPFKYMDGWDYIYEQVGMPFETPMKTVDSTITIHQRDEEIGSESDKLNYFEKNYAVEVYGKVIGLIYKEFLHKEYQAGNTPPASGKYMDGTYGIRLRMIDHN